MTVFLSGERPVSETAGRKLPQYLNNERNVFMNILALLGLILDDLSGIKSRLDAYETEKGIAIEPYGTDGTFSEFVNSILNENSAHDFAVIIKANENCCFEISEIEYINSKGNQESKDVSEIVNRIIDSANLTEIYHMLCEEIANAY